MESRGSPTRIYRGSRKEYGDSPMGSRRSPTGMYRGPEHPMILQLRIYGDNTSPENVVTINLGYTDDSELNDFQILLEGIAGEEIVQLEKFPDKTAEFRFNILFEDVNRPEGTNTETWVMNTLEKMVQEFNSSVSVPPCGHNKGPFVVSVPPGGHSKGPFVSHLKRFDPDTCKYTLLYELNMPRTDQEVDFHNTARNVQVWLRELKLTLLRLYSIEQRMAML